MGPDQMDGKLAEILSDSQMKRLKELRLQRQGAMALTRKDIADQVGLTDDERLKLRGMIDEAMDSMRPQDNQQIGQGGVQMRRPDPQAMESMHEKISDQILRSLTSKQRAKWNDLVGKPFKFDENWRPQPRTRGGLGQDSRMRSDGPPPPPEEDGGN
jgi:hypothetical protein